MSIKSWKIKKRPFDGSHGGGQCCRSYSAVCLRTFKPSQKMKRANTASPPVHSSKCCSKKLGSREMARRALGRWNMEQVSLRDTAPWYKELLRVNYTTKQDYCKCIAHKIRSGLTPPKSFASMALQAPLSFFV